MRRTDPARAAARARHPSTRSPVPSGMLRSRVAARLRGSGSRHAAVASALLEARGSSGADLETFAARMAVEPELLRRAEAGEIPLARLPPALHRLVATDH